MERAWKSERTVHNLKKHFMWMELTCCFSPQWGSGVGGGGMGGGV